MGRFDGKVALITGAASGMGRAVSVRLASEGAAVFGVDVNDEGLAETASQVTGSGGRIETQRADLSSVADCGAVAAGCVAAFGRMDVLGNIAGLSWQDRVEDVTEDGWDRMFDVNVKGMFFLTQAALPHLLASGGNIVNFASNAGIQGMAYLTTYCATKAAVVQLTRGLAMELSKTAVRVNAIAPGGVDTPMTRNYQQVDDPDRHFVRRMMAFKPMSRPEHIAALFAFVASDDCPGIHGAILSADGGLTTG
ncbi:MAG: SDR family NAD(P)-dependent oxidoreductase [Acidimicrobiaceae bacterium]|nr:SDR family NAD(P)-dependent oxidoreductase [Acidimicrobiaceae bacterium]